jgi:7-carboxy-7-deazaguanine synthase
LLSAKGRLTTAPTLRVTECYESLQGEGLLTGTASVFVRLAGCNLRCWFCDTPYSSWQPEGEHHSIDAIAGACLAADAMHVVVTGGEPMLFEPLVALVGQLRNHGRHVTIETAGTVVLPLQCDLMSISPKLVGSGPKLDGSTSIDRWVVRHEQTRWNPIAIEQLIRSAKQTQLKFVVDTPAEVDQVRQHLDQLPEDVRQLAAILLMPQATSVQAMDEKRTWLEPMAAARGWAYCDRAHLRWYGNRRGT